MLKERCKMTEFTKKGRLSKVELSYIEHSPDKSIEEIAKDLNRSVNVVQKAMDAIKKEASEKRKGTVEQTEKQETQMMKLMGRKTVKGRTGIAIMTKEASELSDATRSNRIKNKKINDAIHKPLG